MGVSLVASAVALEWLVDASDRWPATPMNLGLITFAMAHGAADAEILRRSWRRADGARLVFSYMALLAVAGGFLWIAPAAVLVLFLLLSAWHFGRDAGETSRGVGIRQGGLGDVLLTALRAFLVIGVPVLANWDQAAPFFHRTIALLSIDQASFFPASDRVTQVSDRLTTSLLAVLALTAIAVVHWIAWRGSGGQSANSGLRIDRKERIDRRFWMLRLTIEHLVLLAAALMLHPLFFVGLYLGGWHATAHLRELPPVRTARQRAFSIVSTCLFLAPVWILVWVAWIWSEPSPSTPLLAPEQWAEGDTALNLAAIVLLTYAAVTWPHAWLDWCIRRRRVASC